MPRKCYSVSLPSVPKTEVLNVIIPTNYSRIAFWIMIAMIIFAIIFFIHQRTHSR